MLYLHEVHRVVGTRETDFEAAFRDGWMPTLADGDDARLLWFLHLSHGTGRSYQVVTVTAVRDTGAWERLAHRVQRGDLRAWARQVDELRHDVSARLLEPLPFSPLEVDLDAVPVDGGRHDPVLYMEDTMWPRRGMLDQYVDAAGDVYSSMLEDRGERAIVRIEAGFRTVPGGGRHPEVTLLQRVQRLDGLIGLLTTPLPPQASEPGTWMHDALRYRDRWHSKLLRSATWSPLGRPATTAAPAVTSP
jgi:hypothetical protein